MHKFISSFHYSKVLRLVFVWSIFIGFSGLIFSTNIISTPEGLALAPSQAHAGDLCNAMQGFGIFECITKVVLFAPAQLFSIGIGLAVSIIAYSTDPNVFNKLFELQAVYTAWGVVRDIFNVIFIFVLLFSAFATIFRVQKYHLKNILLMVILMALLVNFSWPLAGLVIDFSNVLMLFFLGDQTGISLSSGIGDNSSFAKNILLEGADEKATIQDNDYSALIMVSIFTFIFMVTMFAVAFQLFLRTIVLLVLLIFSPIGIAGAAIPKMQGLSKMWWENFTKYVFTGPIAVFMLVFAAALMQDFIASDLNANLNGNAGSAGAAWGSGLITNIQKFIIPMCILWVGVVASSKLSDVGSKFVTSRARALGVAGGKRFAKTYTRAVAGNIATLGNSARVEGAVAGKFRGVGKQFDNLQTRAAAKRQGFADKSEATYLTNQSYRTGGDPYAVKKQERTATSKLAKEIQESGIDAKAAAAQYKDAKDIEKAALAKFMSSKDAISSDEDLAVVLKAFNEDIVSEKNNPTAGGEKIVEKAEKNAAKAISALDDFGVSKFKQPQYKEIRENLKGTETGDKIIEDLDEKLIAKKRYDIKTEYEIQNDGDPTAVVNKLSVGQIAESEGLAKVLAKNSVTNIDQSRKLASAIQKKIKMSSKSEEQFQMRTNENVTKIYDELGVL